MNSSKEKDEHIFYSGIFRNTETISIPASFQENRLSALIKHPSDYTVAVVRFSIPCDLVPLFIQPTNNNYYTVSVSDGVNTFTQNVVYNNLWGVAGFPPNSITSYSQMIFQINTALRTAASQLTTVHPGLFTTAPKLCYDEPTQLFKMVFATTDDPKFGHVYFNTALSTLFPSFPYNILSINSTNGLDNMLYYDVNKVNNTYYNFPVISQEVVAIGALNYISRIYFTSNNIGVRKQAIYSPSGFALGSPVLIDFEPFLANEDFRGADVVQFYPQGELRRMDLQTNQPMSVIDINVFWEDRFGNTYPLMISPGQVFTILLMFEKKG